ncbi:hypothetical protein PHLCEN_2v236 [Hermanssonia centrifuga]|uniref:Uncharacterized protein n=1 Tax=Hermanssonia centrifuga TaxID=98765 RepID=A0A2R6S6K0_9APHY|nr:hypothetical protein PHLCEN_2v236 [Hermanssonia centrifuga]
MSLRVLTESSHDPLGVPLMVGFKIWLILLREFKPSEKPLLPGMPRDSTI